MIRTILSIIVVVALAFGGIAWRGQQVQVTRKHWGAQVRTYALETAASHDSFDVAQNIRDQLAVAEELGLTTLRFDYERDPAVTRTALELAKAAGFETVLTIDPDRGGIGWNETTVDFTTLGRTIGSEAVANLSGLVDVWQLANEVTGSAVHQPDDTGPTIPNRYNLTFDRQRYENVRDYTKAMGEAIRAVEPDARLMLTGHWVLVDIFPMLERDGVPFDIVGWDWYSDQGTDPANRVIDEGGALNLPQFFADMGKEFWFAETNYESGSFEGRSQAQADWFRTMGKAVGSNPQVQGVVVHMLIDKADEVVAKRPTGSLGLVEVTVDSAGVAAIGARKPAFAAYRDAVRQYQTLSGQPLGLLDSLAVRAAQLLQ